MSHNPPHSAPPVINVASISHPVDRNQAINQSYHAFSDEMAKYLGLPKVCSWTTYGQHASREAGQQIANLHAGLQILNDAGPILRSLTSPFDDEAAKQAAGKIDSTIRRILALIQEEGLMKQSLQLAFAKAGVTRDDLDGLENAANEVAEDEWTDLIPGVAAGEKVALAYFVVRIGLKIGTNLTAIIQAVQRVNDNMIKGNREIYENIAPAHNRFLNAALAARDGVVDVSRLQFMRDASGFVRAAFVKYSEARVLSNQIARSGANATLVAQRNALVHEANLLIGFQEQLVILQPIFNTMLEELTAMNGTMVIRDPNGTHLLVDNWGDFYTRMGLNPVGAPANPNAIRVGNLPSVQSVGGAPIPGTIAGYFERWLTDTRIHQAPPPIAAH